MSAQHHEWCLKERAKSKACRHHRRCSFSKMNFYYTLSGWQEKLLHAVLLGAGGWGGISSSESNAHDAVDPEEFLFLFFFGNDLFKTIPLLLKMLLPNKPCILITKITFIAVCTSMALLCLLWESPSPEQIQTWKCSKHPAAISTSANGFSLLEYPSWVTCAWTICFLR